MHTNTTSLGAAGVGDRSLVIDTDAVLDLASRLTRGARIAEDLSIDVDVAVARSGLANVATSSLIEIDEELTLLATILTDRAMLAAGFRIHLDDARENELALWESITDGVGEDALIEGDAALTLLLDQAGGADADGNGYATIEELEALADDETTPASVRRAIDAILGDDDLIGRIIRNDSSGAPFSPGISIDAIEQWLAENEQLRTEIESSDSIDRPTQIEAVNRRVFAHDPSGARLFLPKLDNAADGNGGLPINAMSTPAVIALHESAMTGVGEDEIVTRIEIVSQLPETPDATRNGLITETYAWVGIEIDRIVNGELAGRFDAEGHAGNNWPLVGSTASGTIGEVLRGDVPVSFAGVPLPTVDAADQLAADANQVIFTDVLVYYGIFTETFADGSITPERVDSFLSIFGEGQDNLRTGFALQLAAMQATDPAERQRLQLEANVVISSHEQAVADPHLDLTPVIDSIDLPTGDAAAEAVAEIVFTANAELRVPRPDGTVWVIDLSQPVPPTSDPNNLVLEVDLSDESNPDALTIEDADIAGTDDLPTITGTEAAHGVSIDVDDWALEQADLMPNVWQNYGDRMPKIARLFQNHHSNPAFYEAAELTLDAD